MDILFLDLETTGLTPSNCGILEIAAELYSNGRFIERYSKKSSLMSHLNDNKISLAALKINESRFHEDTEQDEKALLLDFSNWLLELFRLNKIEGKLVLCGHNVHFDLNFIKQRLEKYGIYDWDSAISYRVLDTSVIGRFLLECGAIKFDKDASKGTSLEKIAQALNINTTNRKLHSAEEDVKLTVEVYYSMKELMERLCLAQKQN